MGVCTLPCPMDGGVDPRDFRILKRLVVATGATGRGDPAATNVGVAVDCETTGLSHEHDGIVELGLRRFRFDDDGVVTKIDRPYAWLEDPGRPIPPEVVALTTITDADVAGRSIDDEVAGGLLSGATIIVAHNARFDRGFVERRLPMAAGMPWACSCEEVPWSDRGFDGKGRGLGWLLAQGGWFHDGHRAGSDVDAVIALMSHRFKDDRTALSLLLEASARPGWIIRARGAHFDVKDRLKARGYRWESGSSVWAREVPDAGRLCEEAWLAANVYSAEGRPRSMSPSFEEVTSRTRHL